MAGEPTITITMHFGAHRGCDPRKGFSIDPSPMVNLCEGLCDLHDAINDGRVKLKEFRSRR